MNEMHQDISEINIVHKAESFNERFKSLHARYKGGESLNEEFYKLGDDARRRLSVLGQVINEKKDFFDEALEQSFLMDNKIEETALEMLGRVKINNNNVGYKGELLIRDVYKSYIIVFNFLKNHYIRSCLINDNGPAMWNGFFEEISEYLFAEEYEEYDYLSRYVDKDSDFYGLVFVSVLKYLLGKEMHCHVLNFKEIIDLSIIKAEVYHNNKEFGKSYKIYLVLASITMMDFVRNFMQEKVDTGLSYQYFRLLGTNNGYYSKTTMHMYAFTEGDRNIGSDQIDSKLLGLESVYMPLEVSPVSRDAISKYIERGYIKNCSVNIDMLNERVILNRLTEYYKHGVGVERDFSETTTLRRILSEKYASSYKEIIRDKVLEKYGNEDNIEEYYSYLDLVIAASTKYECSKWFRATHDNDWCIDFQERACSLSEVESIVHETFHDELIHSEIISPLTLDVSGYQRNNVNEVGEFLLEVTKSVAGGRITMQQAVNDVSAHFENKSYCPGEGLISSARITYAVSTIKKGYHKDNVSNIAIKFISNIVLGNDYKKYNFPVNPEASLYLGAYYLATGDREKSLSLWREVVDKHDMYPEKEARYILQISTKLVDIEKEIASENAAREKERELFSYLTHTLRNSLATGPETLRQTQRLLKKELKDHTIPPKVVRNIGALFSTFVFTDSMVTTFKQLISDPDSLNKGWAEDKNGHGNISWLVAVAIRQVLSRILFSDRFIGARKRVIKDDIVTVRQSFMDEIMSLDIKLDNVDIVYSWCNMYLPFLEIKLDESATDYCFSNDQVKFSILFAVVSEVLLNAIKYWNGEGNIMMTWVENVDEYVLEIVNSSDSASHVSTNSGGKGLSFIETVLEKLDQASIEYRLRDDQFLTSIKIGANAGRKNKEKV